MRRTVAFIVSTEHAKCSSPDETEVYKQTVQARFTERERDHTNAGKQAASDLGYK